ncbi:AAA family ATPase [uncultured Dysgonomonas sp.]|nr:AAA family ATPase [uncultured Dysgonomonas sp.]
MRKIKRVEIFGFWEDKTVKINFDDNVNFLIGTNGSGKTTIINLVAACLDADFQTLDKIQFSRIRVVFSNLKGEGNKQTYIEAEKVSKENSLFISSTNIVFKVKKVDEPEIAINLNEREEDSIYRYHSELLKQRMLFDKMSKSDDIKSILNSFVNFTWLSINRSNNRRFVEEKGGESSIDKKIQELSIDLAKYFGVLDRRYSIETERFQKNIFLSLIEDETDRNIFSVVKDLDFEKEKESVKQIFLLFKLKESEFKNKLERHFKSFEIARQELIKNSSISTKQFASLTSTQRLHSIVQEWNILNEKKNDINKPKFTFINEINNLFNNKKIIINDKNELFVVTSSGKKFDLSQLSSGEKQLFIILGQSLLQENNTHIYIADEPELSLHVEWQEKLVDCIKNINPNSQIIFATHSPDIVGSYGDYVIDVKNVIK